MGWAARRRGAGEEIAMDKGDFAVLLALCAALASALGNVARQRSAQTVTDQPVGYVKLFGLSMRDYRWQLGALAAIANYALQAAALSMGSVIVVTGLQVTALLFALPIYARLNHLRITRWEWMWAALLAAALGVILTVGEPSAGRWRASLETWIVVAITLGPALVFCLLGARIWAGRAISAVLLALVSGSSLALFAVLAKGVVDVLGRDAGAVWRTPELYACVLAALAGMVFQQSAYRAGSLTAAMPAMTVAKPTVGSLLGVLVLGETVRAGDETIFVLLVAAAAVIIATAALARGEAAAAQGPRQKAIATGAPAVSTRR
jgi:drug/metabolite transporter (DMT)-like permease